jgi:hypothetical protein
MIRSIFIFLLRLTLASAALLAGDGPVVGVLEVPQCNEKNGRCIRALFARRGKQWVPLSNEVAGRKYLSPKMNWELGIGGKSLGSIQSVDPGFSSEYSWTYPRDRFLNVPSSTALPKAPNTNHQFQGWCSTPDERPIIAISMGSVTDSNKWVASSLDSRGKRRLLGPFKKAVGRALICPKEGEPPIPFNFTLENIEVVDCFESALGQRLVTLRLILPKGIESCDGPIEAAWDKHTFLISSGVSYVGVGLDFVGAFDSPAAGQSEMLFWHSGYNEDGYLLFSVAQKQKVKYFWGYH